MSSAHAQLPPQWFANDSSRNTTNARTLAALVALRNQEIAERIKQLREDKGNPPQPVVAAAIGVSLRALQKYEAGDAIPRYHNLGRLAEYYGVTESYILEGVDTRPAVHGVPEQLSDVDEKFSELVGAVVDQLGSIEEKLDRLLHMVDRGLFTPREDGAARETQVGLGATLAGMFQANPEALAALVEMAQAPQDPQVPEVPARTAGGPRSRRAG